MYIPVIENKMVRYCDAEGYVFGSAEVDNTSSKNLTLALNAAIRAVRGALGEDVDTLMPYDPRVAELVFIFTDDLYTNRGVSAKVSGATRQLVATMELQLRMELRKKREGGA